MKPQAAKRITFSSMPLDTSKHGSKYTQKAMAYLQPLLPTGWERYFSARRAGKWWGLSVKCPVCGDLAPPELHYSSRKWRWLSVHLASHRPARIVKEE